MFTPYSNHSSMFSSAYFPPLLTIIPKECRERYFLILWLTYVKWQLSYSWPADVSYVLTNWTQSNIQWWCLTGDIWTCNLKLLSKNTQWKTKSQQCNFFLLEWSRYTTGRHAGSGICWILLMYRTAKISCYLNKDISVVINRYIL